MYLKVLLPFLSPHSCGELWSQSDDLDDSLVAFADDSASSLIAVRYHIFLEIMGELLISYYCCVIAFLLSCLSLYCIVIFYFIFV